jgi:peptidyl-tRNA hydrolase
LAKRKRRYVYHSPESEAKAKSNLKQNKERTIEEIKKEAREFQSKRKKLKDLDIIEFAENPAVLGLSFAKRPVQKVILKALYGLPLNKKELEIFKILTKNKGIYKPGMERTEAVLALGARAGKSFIASICALYEATVGWLNKDWKETLSVGENIYICIIATRELQARQIIQNTCLRMLENSPMLKNLILKSTELEITLRNRVKIISGPCNSTALRGLPIVVLILDELAFYRIEGPLTCQASTDFVNPLIPKAFLEKEKARDIDNYLREYQAIFAEKVETFLSYELVENSLRLAGDLAYQAKYQYHAGIDASGLSGRDKFALAISHKQGNDIYVDTIRVWDLKDPDPIMRDIGELTKIYHIRKVSIDRYAKGWVKSALEKVGLEVELRPSLAEIYVNIKSLMLGNRLYLPDNQAIKKAFLNTQAYYGKNNTLSIAHERSRESSVSVEKAVNFYWRMGS